MLDPSQSSLGEEGGDSAAGTRGDNDSSEENGDSDTTRGDGSQDDGLDSDGDGLSDRRELSPPVGVVATDPDDPDTDNDGSNDGDDPAPTVAGCQEELLFFDDFRGPSRNSWSDVKGSWELGDGGVLTSADPTVGGAVTWIGDRNWRNYDVNIRIRLDPSGSSESSVHDAGLIFRSTEVSDVNNGGAHYYVGLYPNQDRMTLGIMDGRWKAFASEEQEVELGRWYDVTVRVRGASLKISLDGNEVISTQDNMYLEGSIGLRTFLQGASYDQVIVCR